ncbi:MAG TPA: hypothetical protein VGN63_09900 [Flavisolibacter sp.]|jgi:hypothetical protein|nr:hypothetical protein [Flavisolibacter sp.]
MNQDPRDPKKNKDNTASTFETRPDQTPRREGGDDALAETNPSDSRLDEKVVVNTQSENKIVNTPSQSEPHMNGDNRVDEL